MLKGELILDVNKNNISINVKFDGIYLTLSNPSYDKIEKQKAIESAIAFHNINNINNTAIDILLSSEEFVTEERISTDTILGTKVDESASIFITDDNMKAYMVFKKPHNGGKKLSEKEINDLIFSSGVIYGIDKDLLSHIILDKQYDVEYLIATGIKPIEGTPGYLKYYFDTSPKTYKPKVLESGEVDFKELSLITTVEKDQVLIEIIPKVDGTEGMTVFGTAILPKKLSEPTKLPKGNNVYKTEDGRCLVSGIKGSLTYVNGIVNISEVLVIKGDVGTSTGNINYNGSVSVEGNVVTGFKIIAMGNIEIFGAVEGAEIISDGNVFISKTFNGMNKGIIRAQGDIVAGFVKDATLFCENNIYSDCIMHSKVRCKGSIYLDGTKGLLVGGNHIVGKNIVAKTLGSRMATNTVINLGFDPELYIEYNEIVNNFIELKKEVKLLDSRLKNINKMGDFKSLTEDKKSVYLGIVHRKEFLMEKIFEVKKRIIKLSNYLNKEEYSNKVEVSLTLYTGIKLRIGNAYIHITDARSGCIINNKSGDINIVLL